MVAASIVSLRKSGAPRFHRRNRLIYLNVGVSHGYLMRISHSRYLSVSPGKSWEISWDISLDVPREAKPLRSTQEHQDLVCGVVTWSRRAPPWQDRLGPIFLGDWKSQAKVTGYIWAIDGLYINNVYIYIYIWIMYGFYNEFSIFYGNFWDQTSESQTVVLLKFVNVKVQCEAPKI